MTIKEGDFIKISYTGKMEDGTVFDTTNEEAAKVHNLYNPKGRYGGDVIIIGVNQIIAGLEEDIKQHDVGYEGTVSIPPEKAFGVRDPQLVKALPMKKFEQKPQVGMPVEISGQTGTVVKVLGRHASVDFNIPMAGQTITYDYKIEAILEDLSDKAVGLGTLYTGTELDIDIDGTVAKINVPLEFNYSRHWITSKAQMALDLLKYTDLTEVLYVETYTKDLLTKTADGM
ncbi:MAG: peptidylprolyl isomerase, partial [ANME-2 cluster archaeon]|nr:peptidylprolyl isomerase [ANME-2 cluster archaeon]